MEIKPGWKTSEFWLSFAAFIVGSLLASGVIPAESIWAQLVGFAGAALAAMGYTYKRSAVKEVSSSAAALTEAKKL